MEYAINLEKIIQIEVENHWAVNVKDGTIIAEGVNERTIFQNCRKRKYGITPHQHANERNFTDIEKNLLQVCAKR